MKRSVVFCVMMVLVCMVNAQKITIKEKDTGKPIESVYLICEALQIKVTTDINGQADISAFVGSMSIEIQAKGFETEVKSFEEIKQVNYTLLLSKAVFQFDETVVSGTRWKQYSKDVPSKIITILPKDVAWYNPQNAADLLGSTGEVFIQKSQQGGGSPMIRGFSSNRLLYTIDGIRMNTAIFRSGNVHQVISLDPFAIEHTEVFFGPGSVIYGSDAIGGVMSFQTLTPQLSATGKLLVTGKFVSRMATANNEITNHLDVGLGWKKWASVTSVTYSKFDDLRMGANGRDDYLRLFYVTQDNGIDTVVKNANPLIQNPSGYAQFNLMQKIRYSPHKKWNIIYGFHYSGTSSFARYDRLIETQSNGMPQSAVWNYGPQIWMMNHLSITHNSRNKMYDRMNIRLGYQLFEESRVNRSFSGIQKFILRTNLENVHAYSVNVDFEKRNMKHQFYYGIEYVLNQVVSLGSAIDIRNNQSILIPDRYPASDWHNSGFYINHQYILSEKLLFQTGARFSAFIIQSNFNRHRSFNLVDFSYTNIQNSSTTGSVGFIYTPQKTWKISINGSTGFRAPNVDDIGKIFEFTTGEIVVPNTSLNAEYAYNGEINIAKIFHQFIKLDFTVFNTLLDNAMVRRTFNVNGQDSILYNGQMSRVYAIQNAAFARVYGLNAGIEMKLPLGLILTSRYNYQLGKEEMDNGVVSRSRHAAPAFGTTRLSFEKNKYVLQFYAFYNAEVSHHDLNFEERQKTFLYAKDANGQAFSPSWYIINFKAMFQLYRHLSISTGVENITDQRYRPYSAGIAAPGRNFILSCKVNF